MSAKNVRTNFITVAFIFNEYLRKFSINFKCKQFFFMYHSFYAFVSSLTLTDIGIVSHRNYQVSSIDFKIKIILFFSPILPLTPICLYQSLFFLSLFLLSSVLVFFMSTCLSSNTY